MNALLTKLEAASFLEISPSTVDRLRKADRFPAPAPSFKAKPLLWTQSSLEAFRDRFATPRFPAFTEATPAGLVPMRKLRALRKGGAK